jgi:hypothetical protein
MNKSGLEGAISFRLYVQDQKKIKGKGAPGPPPKSKPKMATGPAPTAPTGGGGILKKIHKDNFVTYFTKCV